MFRQRETASTRVAAGGHQTIRTATLARGSSKETPARRAELRTRCSHTCPESVAYLVLPNRDDWNRRRILRQPVLICAHCGVRLCSARMSVLSRRKLIKGGISGAVVLAGRELLPTVASPAALKPAPGCRAHERKIRRRPWSRGFNPDDQEWTHRELSDNSAARLPARRTIDLGGRTVIPGFFDAHVHYTRAAINPGHEARRIERAFSIAELQETHRAPRGVRPAGRVRHMYRRLEPHAVRRSTTADQRRNWMLRRRNIPSTFPVPAEEPAPSRTASAGTSSLQRA